MSTMVQCSDSTVAKRDFERELRRAFDGQGNAGMRSRIRAALLSHGLPGNSGASTADAVRNIASLVHLTPIGAEKLEHLAHLLEVRS